MLGPGRGRPRPGRVARRGRHHRGQHVRVHRRGQGRERRHHPRDGAVQESGLPQAGRDRLPRPALPGGARARDPRDRSYPRLGRFAGIAKAVAEKPRRRGPRTLPVMQVSETPEYIYDHTAPRIIGGPRSRSTSRSPRAAIGRARSASSPSCAARSAAARSTRGRRGGAPGRRGGARGQPGRAGPDPLRRRPRRQADAGAAAGALGSVDGLRWIRLHYTYPSASTTS